MLRPLISTAPKLLGVAAPALAAVNPAAGAIAGAAAAGTSALDALVNKSGDIKENVVKMKESLQKISQEASPFIKFKKA